MSTTFKIILSGIVGTSFMTLYSYMLSKHKKEQYLEPELLNRLIDRSKYLPTVSDTKKNPAGWIAHYAIGLGFVITYRQVWKEVLINPSILKTLSVGTLSGLIGILSWKILFEQHENPPQNDRNGYYIQLLYAHLWFAAFSILTYKKLSKPPLALPD